MGRFVNEDTHWNPTNMIYGDDAESENPTPSISAILQSTNLYAYCSGDPVNRFDITGNEWGSIRDFAESLANIYGSDYEFHLNQNSTWLTMGGGYSRKDGTFWYDGGVYMPDTGMIEGRAQNIDGRMYMQRADFYRAMGIDYEIGQISFTVTPEGNAINSFISGLVISAIFKGNFVSGVVGGAIDYIYSRDVGDYWVRTTTAYQYDPMGDWYDTITTYEVYYKHPSYSEYTAEPIEIVTWYSRVEELY